MNAQLDTDESLLDMPQPPTAAQILEAMRVVRWVWERPELAANLSTNGSASVINGKAQTALSDVDKMLYTFRTRTIQNSLPRSAAVQVGNVPGRVPGYDASGKIVGYMESDEAQEAREATEAGESH